MTNARLLLIDDDPALLEALSQTLELLVENLSVETVDSPGGALQKLMANTYDVIISDLSMPEMNGLTLAREIKTRGLMVPFILISGSPSMMDQAQGSGVFGIISKPFDRRYLQKIVSLALRYGKTLCLIQSGLHATQARIRELTDVRAMLEKQIRANQAILDRRYPASVAPKALSRASSVPH